MNQAEDCLILTHLSIAPQKRDIRKQCRSRSDAAERSADTRMGLMMPRKWAQWSQGNGLNDPKENKNKNCTMMKYGETFTVASWHIPTASVITKTRLFKYIENFTTKKNENFQVKKSDIFHIFSQNIDCGTR